jgi:ABC-type molybdenum transport system ATPase subunit/photorepair protein PhrA
LVYNDSSNVIDFIALFLESHEKFNFLIFNPLTMLTAHNLTKQYGDYTALNKLNLTIQAGEIFALLGQNGAGKTTTINCF